MTTHAYTNYLVDSAGKCRGIFSILRILISSLQIGESLGYMRLRPGPPVRHEYGVVYVLSPKLIRYRTAGELLS